MPGGISQSDERLWATLAHISIPFIGFIGPLIVYLIFKDKSAWLKESSTEALNFSILYTIAQIVAGILTLVIIGAILLPLIAIGGLVLCILAADRQQQGRAVQVPDQLADHQVGVSRTLVFEGVRPPVLEGSARQHAFRWLAGTEETVGRSTPERERSEQLDTGTPTFSTAMSPWTCRWMCRGRPVSRTTSRWSRRWCGRRRRTPPRTAVLYLHGWNDYFFQTHVADAFTDAGIDFYALDLRRYGRSLRRGHLPTFITDLDDYGEEIGQAADLIAAEHDRLIITAHSTGGLIACPVGGQEPRPGRGPGAELAVAGSAGLGHGARARRSGDRRRRPQPAHERAQAARSRFLSPGAPLLAGGRVGLRPHAEDHALAADPGRLVARHPHRAISGSPPVWT